MGAWDGEGRDVLEQLSRRDHIFASGFTAAPYDGFANLHALTLDLGRIDAQTPAEAADDRLCELLQRDIAVCGVAGGYQAGLSVCRGAIAGWNLAAICGRCGFPAGLERTIVIDLTGKLPAGARNIRLMTNLEIYWDQVLIDNHAEAASHTTEVPLALATLHFRGYPKQIDGASPGDLDYDYDRVSLTGPFQHERGNYTRMGDVTALVKGIDDRYAIFGSGEEIAAEFDVNANAGAARAMEA